MLFKFFLDFSLSSWYVFVLLFFLPSFFFVSHVLFSSFHKISCSLPPPPTQTHILNSPISVSSRHPCYFFLSGEVTESAGVCGSWWGWGGRKVYCPIFAKRTLYLTMTGACLRWQVTGSKPTGLLTPVLSFGHVGKPAWLDGLQDLQGEPPGLLQGYKPYVTSQRVREAGSYGTGTRLA